MAITFRGLGSAPATGDGVMYYDTGSDLLKVYSDGEWRNALAYASYGEIQNMGGFAGAKNWAMRVVYAKGYMMGGYRSSSPWKNINATHHHTDITVNLGDKLTYQAGYCCGGFSDSTGYMYGTIDSFPGNSTHVDAFNMTSETSRDCPGSLTDSKNDGGTFQKDDNTRSWVYAGGADDCCRHQFQTDSFSHIHNLHSADNDASTCYGDQGGHGYMPKGSYKMNMSSESNGSMPNVIANQTHAKALPSKHYKWYGENNGNSTSANQVYKYFTTTDTNAVSPNFKPWTAGETNYEMGQNHGYGLGACGVNCQDNATFKTYYHTDGHVAGSTAMEIKGHDGASSGGNSSCDY